MRSATGKFAGGFAALLIFLTACGSGQDSTNSTGAAKRKPAPVASAPALPGKPVCEVVTQDQVSQIIGQAILSSDDISFINGLSEPTLCNYYVDPDKSNKIDIQQMSKAAATWDYQIADLGKSAAKNIKSSRITGTSLSGVDAFKEAPLSGDGVSVYWVLVKEQGPVVRVTGMDGLSDDRLRALTRAAVQAVK